MALGDLSKGFIGGALATLVVVGGGIAIALQTLQARLALPEAVGVQIDAKVPVHAAVDQPIAVSLDEEMTASVRLSELRIPIDETLELPLNLQLDVPIDTEVLIEERVPVNIDVPIELVLTEKELDLSALRVPIDTEIFVDDEVLIDTTIDFETEVETTLGMVVPAKGKMPVKMRVPIRQKLRVRDTIDLSIPRLRVPLKVVVPIRTEVPLNQHFRVRAQVRAPIHQRVRIPLRQTITPVLDAPVEATVELHGSVPARLGGTFDAEVALEGVLPAQISPITLRAQDVTIEPR